MKDSIPIQTWAEWNDAVPGALVTLLWVPDPAV